jgi:hypothetical protein
VTDPKDLSDETWGKMTRGRISFEERTYKGTENTSRDTQLHHNQGHVN